MVRAELDRFAATRAQTLALLAGLSQAQLDFAPAPGRWSAGEVFDHLILSEALYRGEIEALIGLARAGREPVLRRSVSEVDVSVAFIPKSLLPLLETPFTLMSALTPRLVLERLARSRLVPAQNPRQGTPRRGRPAAELRDDLVASLARTRALFEGNADLDFRRLVHRHPLMGSNNALDVLRFLSLHEQRHQEQIREALAAAR